ncbi:MAG: hypothetical protein ACLTSK_01825 [Christensenellales bacterium]
MNNELLPVVEPPEIVEPPENSIRDKINELTTAAALQDDEMRSKLVVEKGAELSALSEARRIEAESERQRAVLQKEHERAEHSSRIFEAESTELQSKALKAKAFYDANKAVLNIIGIREPLGLRTMRVLRNRAPPVHYLFNPYILSRLSYKFHSRDSNRHRRANIQKSSVHVLEGDDGNIVGGLDGRRGCGHSLFGKTNI